MQLRFLQKQTSIHMFRLVTRIVLCVFILLVMLLPFYLTHILGLVRANARLVRLSFALGSLVLGLRITRQGTVSDNTPLLVVSNHFSYLDVFVLGSVLPIRFTPKREIRDWFLIGFFCKINNCVFIDRQKSQTLNNKHILEKIIQEGGAISLFAEGTTNDGTGLLPFKSSLFSIAEAGDVTVQPVSIVYTALNEKPVTYQNRHIIGWYGDAEFLPHLMVFLRQRNTEVTAVFHEAVHGRDFASRKELAQYCHDVIATMQPALE